MSYEGTLINAVRPPSLTLSSIFTTKASLVRRIVVAKNTRVCLHRPKLFKRHNHDQDKSAYLSRPASKLPYLYLFQPRLSTPKCDRDGSSIGRGKTTKSLTDKGWFKKG